MISETFFRMGCLKDTFHVLWFALIVIVVIGLSASAVHTKDSASLRARAAVQLPSMKNVSYDVYKKRERMTHFL